MFVKRKMYLSHLASFQGNIGDIASQRAFRAWFESLFPDFEITWQNLEIRKFFRNTNYKWKKMQKELTNSDCLIIGGGNFLELWPENSPTGTSLPFSIPEIESITIPILAISKNRLSMITDHKFTQILNIAELFKCK